MMTRAEIRRWRQSHPEAKADWMTMLMVPPRPPRKTPGLIMFSKDRARGSYQLFCTCSRQKCIDGPAFLATLRPWYRARTRLTHEAGA